MHHDSHEVTVRQGDRCEYLHASGVVVTEAAKLCLLKNPDAAFQRVSAMPGCLSRTLALPLHAPSASPKSQQCFCAGWRSTSTASASGAPPGAVPVLARLHLCLLNLSSQGAARFNSHNAPQEPESCACLDTRTVHSSRLQARHAVLEALW